MICFVPFLALSERGPYFFDLVFKAYFVPCHLISFILFCTILRLGIIFLPCMQPKTLFVDRFFSYFRAGGCIFLTSASCFYKPSSCLSGSFDRIFSTLTPFFQWFSNPPPSFLKFWWPFHLMCFSFCPNLFEAGDRGLFWALAAVKPVQKSPLVPSWKGLECHAGIGRWSSDFGTLDEVCEVILMVQGTSYYKHKCTRASEDLSTRGIRTIDV